MRVLLFLTLILSPIYLYLGLRLSSHWSDWALLALLFALIMSFPFKKFFRYQLQLIYAGMGLLTFITVFTAARDVVWLVSDRLIPVIYVYLMTCLSLILGFLNAYRGPRIRHVKVPINDLSEALEGFKIAQVSDLHVGATIRKPYVENVVAKINALQSDMVVLTGDIGDGLVSHYRQDIAPIATLQSQHGTFFVPGNHEYYWNVNEWLGEMKHLGVTNLVNHYEIIQHHTSRVLIAGIPDPMARIEPKFPEAKAEFKILLSHRPGVAPQAAKRDFHLQLSGHTHGGQFFPWTIVVRFVHKLSQGLHRVENMWVYVNPGTGSWGPLLRLGTTPEITLLELHRAQEFKLIND